MSAAERIAAVVEAERPANRPTLKGLIREDVSTNDLKRLIQSLEAKLGKEKNAQGDGKKSKGNVIALKNMKPTGKVTLKSKPPSKKKKSTRKSVKKPPTKSSPAAKGTNLRSNAKRSAKPKCKGKSCGKGKGKGAAACN